MADRPFGGGRRASSSRPDRAPKFAGNENLLETKFADEDVPTCPQTFVRIQSGNAAKSKHKKIICKTMAEHHSCAPKHHQATNKNQIVIDDDEEANTCNLEPKIKKCRQAEQELLLNMSGIKEKLVVVRSNFLLLKDVLRMTWLLW